MTIDELAQDILANHFDEYAFESIEPIIEGIHPRRRHKKKRIAKKWKTRYGMKPKIVYKKCKKVDVGLDLIVDYCAKYGKPLPEELLNCETTNS